MSAVDDPLRLAALERSGLLGSPETSGVDRLLRIALHAFDVRTAMFCVVDADRQVFVDQIGLPEDWAEAGETPLSHSYCRLVVNEDAPLVVTDAGVDERVRDNPATSEASIGAYLGVPVRAPDGEPLGSFCVMHRMPRAWTADEVAILGDLAASLEVELRLRSTTAELADQLAAEQLERSFEASMAALAAAASSSWTASTLLEVLVRDGQDAAGARLISIAVLDGDNLRYFHGDGVSEDVAEQWIAGSLDDPVPMAHAVKTGDNVVLQTSDAFALWPVFAEAVENLGISSFVALPVGEISGGSRAVVGVGWSHPLSSAAVPRSVLRLGALTRHGLERAHSHQAARSHAELLESLVLPDELPPVEHLDLSGLYLPPTAGQRVGGDLYEVTRRGDGKVALITADAAGHDAEASKATSRLRTALNMLTLEQLSPAAILSYVTTYLKRSNVSTLITCVYALVDVDRGEITVANAGHPQPRLRRSTGAVSAIGPLGQPLLGFRDFEYSETTVSFTSGDLVALFTDGLIERRNAPLERGEAWLESVLSTASTLTAHELAEGLVADLENRADDVAVLVAVHTGPVSGNSFSHRCRASDLDLAAARHDLAGWLGDDTPNDTILLVATELLTNARTASATDDATVELEASHREGGVRLIVTNQGPAFSLGRIEMPTTSVPGGRGLALVASMCDLEVVSEPPLVRVIAQFRPQDRI